VKLTRRARLAGGGLLALLAVSGTVAFSGCSSDNFRDIEGVKNRNPDAIINVQNVDKHPNIVFLCVYGQAFFTTTRDYHAIERDAGLDNRCPTSDKRIGQ
jgi:hypothetical protein